MTDILAIDPGCTESAFVLYRKELQTVEKCGKWANSEVLTLCRDRSYLTYPTLVIEAVACYGMAVGYEVFETVFWSGQFYEAWKGPRDRMYRQDVKLHLCNSVRAKDGNIRTALLDVFGGTGAVGTKKKPGPLFGVSGDIWAALAVAVTYSDGVRSKIKGT